MNLAGTGEGVVRIQPADIGADCDSATKRCEYVVDIGAQVELAASASSASTFVDWAGGCAGISETCTVTVNEPLEVTANVGTPGEHLWSEALTGGGADSSRVAIDDAGNVVVAFRNIGMLAVGGQSYAGNSDLLVVKFRRDKSLVWAKQFGGDSSYMEPGNLDIAPNGDVVLVAVGSSVTLDGETLPLTFGNFLARLDGETGAKKALQTIGSGSDFGATTVKARGDEILVVGTLTGSVDLGNGTITSTGTDIVLAWYSATGSLIRTHWITGSGNEYGGAVVDGNGNVFVAGSYSGTMDVLPGGTGGELVAAEGTSDAFVASFTWDGSFQTAQRYSGPGGEYFNLAVGPAGSPVVAGTAPMGINLNPGGTGGSVTGPFIAMLTPDGALRWKYTNGTGSIAVDGRDSVYFTSVCDAATDFGSGTIPGTGRYCAVRLDNQAGVVWAKRFAVSDSGVMGGVRPGQLVASTNGIHAFAGVAYEDVSYGGPTIPGDSSGFVYVGGP